MRLLKTQSFVDTNNTFTVIYKTFIVVCFLLGDSPASEFLRGITQKKAYNNQDKAKI